ncbi:MAG: glycosyltransferase family 2 protein [Candidatus Melainabacteria bacterium]|nr:glycosyltransferase family 2 protein [Candidatus Melainabacteria bacterium]
MSTKVQTLPDISVFMITLDDAKHLEKSIRQAKKIAKEVIVIDYGSVDNTLRIAEKHADKVYQNPWLGVSRMKSFALARCSYSWVMHLSANEVLTNSLIEEMNKKFVKQMVKGTIGFKIARKFYVGGKFVRWGGFYPDRQLRIFQKSLAHFKAGTLDESVEVWDAKKGIYLTDSPRVFSFEGALDFYPFETIKDMENYYRFNAEIGKKKISYLAALVGTVACFIERFIFQLGFLDGTLGYKMAMILSMYIWRQYKQSRLGDKY